MKIILYENTNINNLKTINCKKTKFNILINICIYNSISIPSQSLKRGRRKCKHIYIYTKKPYNTVCSIIDLSYIRKSTTHILFLLIVIGQLDPFHPLPLPQCSVADHWSLLLVFVQIQPSLPGLPHYHFPAYLVWAEEALNICQLVSAAARICTWFLLLTSWSLRATNLPLLYEAKATVAWLAICFLIISLHSFFKKNMSELNPCHISAYHIHIIFLYMFWPWQWIERYVQRRWVYLDLLVS